MSISDSRIVESPISSQHGPLTFTPTDAAQLSKSFAPEIEPDGGEEKKSLPRRSSRLPLMHPTWYSSSINNSSTDCLIGSGGSVTSSNNDSSRQEVPTVGVAEHDIPKLSVMFNRQKYYSRLVHPSDNRMRIPDHVLPASLFYIIPSNTTDKQSSIVTIFAIWNTMMGTSLLSMPWGLVQSGFTFGILLIVFMGLLTLYTAYRVLQSKDYLDFEAFEFSDVCKHYLGRWGEWVAVIFALVTFLGGMLVYWVLMTNFLYVTGVFIYEKASPNHTISNNTGPEVLCPTGYPIPENTSLLFEELLNNTVSNATSNSFYNWWSSTKTVPLFLAILVFPLLNFKSPTFFTKFNCLGTLSVFFVITFVITKAVNWGWNLEFYLSDDPNGYQLPEFRATFPALTGMLSLAFFLHNAVITIVKTNKNPENNVRDLSLGYLFVALTYLTVGVLFYGSFPLPKACIASNLLENLSTHDGFAVAARLFLLMQMLSVFPLLAYMYRVNALYAIFNSAWPGRTHVILVNLSIVIMCVLVAIFYPHIGEIIRYSGSLCGLVYIFCLPSVVYMMAKRSEEALSPIAILMHSTIIVLGVLNFIAQFIIKPSI
ncbi:neutral amino acid transporter 9-like [Clavelina lepadiformis]|uniref:Neutral amino acid transporter 9 n=1 Tax=Clavelina lepadiformis TaxID=159417 RepID=A0ABP0F868_CLALP